MSTTSHGDIHVSRVRVTLGVLCGGAVSVCAQLVQARMFGLESLTHILKMVTSVVQSGNVPLPNDEQARWTRVSLYE